MTEAGARDGVCAWRSRWQWPPRSALVPPAHLHLTLHFLGDVHADRFEALHTALAAVPFDPFDLQLGTPEMWPHGLAVLRPVPQPRLDRLHEHVVMALQRAGLTHEPTASWKPHLTLARRAPGAQPPGRALSIRWPVNGFSLVWSRQPPDVPRARYELVAQWPSP